MHTLTRLLIFSLALTAVGCSSGARSIRACGSSPVAPDPLSPRCGFQNPEDLLVLPGGRWLAVSQMEHLDGRPGSLVAVPLPTGASVPLYPASGSAAPLSPATPAWGSPDCPGLPDAAAFAPHGIDLVVRPDGTSMLLAVNHGGRQSIELFSLQSGETPALEWRGCVPLPAGTQGNDVAALPDGGFVVSHMTRPVSGAAQLADVMRLLFRRPTGYVLEWHLDQGWRRVPGSEAVMPNGVEVSSDGSLLYFTAWGSRELVRLSLRGEPGRKSTPLPMHPDNLTWLEDGRLLVAGQAASLLKVSGCIRTREGTCPVPFALATIDPSSLEPTLLMHYTGTATGAVSAPAVAGDELYLGTFAGDRLAHGAMPKGPMSQ